MKKIYAPWRGNYVANVAYAKQPNIDKNGCIFCAQFDDNNDDQYFIVKRFAHCAVMLNLYPYNAGHLMILPLEHKAELGELSPETRREIMELMTISVEKLRETLEPAGFNMGINMGKIGGAGIPSHLHVHVVPRWNGDTNFMPVVAETKAISFDLGEIFTKLKKAFESVTL